MQMVTRDAVLVGRVLVAFLRVLPSYQQGIEIRRLMALADFELGSSMSVIDGFRFRELQSLSFSVRASTVKMFHPNLLKRRKENSDPFLMAGISVHRESNRKGTGRRVHLSNLRKTVDRLNNKNDV